MLLFSKVGAFSKAVNGFQRITIFPKSSTRPTTLLEKRLWHRCFPKFCDIFKSTFFTEHLRITGSEYSNIVVVSYW